MVPVIGGSEAVGFLIALAAAACYDTGYALQAIEACATADELLVDYYPGIERNLKPPTVTGARRPGPLVCAFRFGSMNACWRNGRRQPGASRQVVACRR